MKGLLLALLASLLGGCAVRSHCPELMVPGMDYCLQPSAQVAPAYQVQDVRLRFDGKEERLIAHVEIDAEGLRLVALSPLGQPLFSALYDNEAVVVARSVPLPFDPGQLLSLVQLSRWPLESVQAGLGSGLQVKQEAGLRRFSGAAGTLMEVVMPATGAKPQQVDYLFPGLPFELRVIVLTGGE